MLVVITYVLYFIIHSENIFNQKFVYFVQISSTSFLYDELLG
jgi:hypothetical protein